jgi:hypothetical protein
MLPSDVVAAQTAMNEGRLGDWPDERLRDLLAVCASHTITNPDEGRKLGAVEAALRAVQSDRAASVRHAESRAIGLWTVFLAAGALVAAVATLCVMLWPR